MKRALVNNFLIICLIASFAELTANIADEAVGLDLASSYLVLGFYILAFIVAIPFSFVAGSTNALKIRAYIPVLLWLALPSSIVLSNATENSIGLAIVGFGLNLYAFIERRKLTRHRLGWFPSALFSGSTKSWGRGFAALAITVITFAGSVALDGYKVLDEVLAEVGGGNIELKPSGIYGKMKTYQKDKKTVYLISMAHVGDEDFYTKLLNEIPVENSVVMLEGIKDSRNQLSHDLGHKARAEAFGLKTQSEVLSDDKMKGRKIQNADMDIENMSPEAQKYVEYSNGKDMSSLLSIVLNKSDDENVKKAEEKFHKEREEHALLFFDYLVTRYDHLIMPWGAAHISNFAKAMEERGYKLMDERENKIIGF